ncbi:phosphoadenylyl-sulfate reductase [Portibacter marinus]|uniref:phosphoadenylyl-sulfate reductase n=1 Tax=Portibacter marinus TaxID=2898660 RepID=UPI001F2B5F7F|nr:phosphoadenylyl-sulfate reductase [Portibacter marinus]
MISSKETKEERFDFERFSIGKYNGIFENLNPEERLRKLYQYFDEDEILFTSSFGTNSSYLLFLLSKVNPKQKVHFINTGYLFEETIIYKNQLSERFGLEIVEIQPLQQEHALTFEEEWWNDHPKMCCAINKIAPLDKVKKGKKIWVSGVLGFQTDFRSDLGIFAPHGDLYKFHPMIDMEEGQFLYEMNYFGLPKHPLAEFGYGSVGCTHCTVKGKGRNGRWADSEKTECGLHTHYFTNKKELNESK